MTQQVTASNQQTTSHQSKNVISNPKKANTDSSTHNSHVPATLALTQITQAITSQTKAKKVAVTSRQALSKSNDL